MSASNTFSRFHRGGIGLAVLALMAFENTNGGENHSLMSSPDDAVPPPAIASMKEYQLAAFVFVGNTAIADSELSAVGAAYLNRLITFEELDELRRKLTRYYIDKGYINSGVIIPNQVIDNKTLILNVIEGDLVEISITGLRRLRLEPLHHRISRGAGSPLNINSLRRQLERLQADVNVRKISAELGPGPHPGESRLRLRIEEENPWHLLLVGDNHYSPSAGAERLALHLNHTNLTGWGDRLSAELGLTRNGFNDPAFSGLDNVEIDYQWPLLPWTATTIAGHYRRSDFAVIEEPFDRLDIAGESEDYGVSLTHSLIQSRTHDLSLGARLERRQSNTELLGRPFSLSPGAVDGRTRALILRLFQAYVWNTINRLIALRSTFNFGVDAMHPTKSPLTTRDGIFCSWQGQWQWGQRLFSSNAQLILKSNCQWTDDELLPFEQFSLGGHASVRGYRENRVVRDRGWITSAELRLPLIVNVKGQGMLFIAPFIDYGQALDNGNASSSFIALGSAGVGMIWPGYKGFEGQIYWGIPWRNLERQGEYNLQDDGIHVSVIYKFR